MYSRRHSENLGQPRPIIAPKLPRDTNVAAHGMWAAEDDNGTQEGLLGPCQSCQGHKKRFCGPLTPPIAQYMFLVHVSASHAKPSLNAPASAMASVCKLAQLSPTSMRQQRHAQLLLPQKLYEFSGRFA